MASYLVNWNGYNIAKREQEWGEEIIDNVSSIAESFNYFWEHLKDYGLPIHGLQSIQLSARPYSQEENGYPNFTDGGTPLG